MKIPAYINISISKGLYILLLKKVVMKTLFIEAKSTADILPAVSKAVKLLPKKVGLVSTIQHKHKLAEAKKLLESRGIKAVVAGSVLGCNQESAKKIKDKIDAFLYIGSGEFHPTGIALVTGKRVIVANPLSDNVYELDKKEIEKIKAGKKGALLKFYSSNNIGILVSTKSGQNKLKRAFELKKKLKTKNCYIFIADTFDLNQLENFPFIQCWVNTACPRIAEDRKGIVNIEDIK
jgi:2-(3-amino-3-carboxypropyl)histidine synthase